MCLASVMFVGCDQNKIEFSGAIIPHHLLVEESMHEIYDLIGSKEVERVVLFSPNHFNFGISFLQTTNQDFYSEDGILEVDIDFVSELDRDSSLSIEPKLFKKEHGVTSHVDFILEYFPNAEIVPVIIKQGAYKEHMDGLIDRILNEDLSKTFFISSIDFSHVVSEEVAIANDERTTKWIEETKGNIDFDEVIALAESIEKPFSDSIAIDSPESLYLIFSIMVKRGTVDVEVIKRTSSASKLGLEDPEMNTSHLFVVFGVEFEMQ